ncbi:MAG: hypothetical protein ACREEM_20560 [Blastocatellia bacterium]
MLANNPFREKGQLSLVAEEATFADESAAEAARRKKFSAKEESKKDRIIALYRQGVTDVAEIARQVGVRPSYAGRVAQSAGLISGYFDLYTTTGSEQNAYTRFFQNVLAFKTVEAARESVTRIDRLYNYFDRLGDRAGQHHAMVLALTGKNRARWSGKHEAARIFSEWLASH